MSRHYEYGEYVLWFLRIENNHSESRRIRYQLALLKTQLIRDISVPGLLICIIHNAYRPPEELRSQS